MRRSIAHLIAKGGPEMPVTRKQARRMIVELASDYVKASKKQKSEIITHIAGVAGYARSAVTRALRNASKNISAWRVPRGRSKKQRTYGPDVIAALRKVWAILDCPSGKRLAPFLPEVVPILERYGELRLASDSIRDKLLSISASTIDRALAADRKTLQIKGRSGTKPGSLLKNQIRVRTFAEWDDASPGFLEIDLVEHNGGSTRGDFICTLDAVDIATRWTETRAVKNKAQRWVFDALLDMIGRMPFAVLGIDSDNGSEFINGQLIRFCQERQVTFTRSRPNRKNDSCYVEQKNWTVVRRALGYARFDTPEQLNLINNLYAQLRLYTNYFQPVMTLVSKHRCGAKTNRQYDTAKTPYQRAMLSPEITDDVKEQLTQEYRAINPADLKRRILTLQQELQTTLLRRDDPQLCVANDPKLPMAEA